MINHVGQLFLIGFEDEKPTGEFLDFIASESIGGVILFEKNCSSHKIAEENIKKITAACDNIPFIAIDQEGGRVCRLKGVPAEYGAAEDYGSRNDLGLFREQFGRAAYYLHSLGINLLLGPVADLGLNKNNRCLRGRTFGDNPARVIPFVEMAVRLAARAGLLTCLKHFPGLGAAVEDPHEKLAKSDFDMQTFLNREALTFNAGIKAGADLVMTTHLRLPQFDSRPATGSETIINLLLRENLNFDGIAITDDLLMEGAVELGDHGERAVQAFAAGHDILLFGADWRTAKTAVESIKKACLDGRINETRIITSLDRISGIKSKLTVSAF